MCDAGRALLGLNCPACGTTILSAGSPEVVRSGPSSGESLSRLLLDGPVAVPLVGWLAIFRLGFVGFLVAVVVVSVAFVAKGSLVFILPLAASLTLLVLYIRWQVNNT